MKNIFGINVTENEDNEQVDGQVFLCSEIPESQREELDNLSDDADSIFRKMRLPLWARIVLYTAGIGTFAGFSFLIENIADTSFVQVYDDMPFLFYLTGGLGFLALFLFAWSQNRAEIVRNSHEMNAMESASHLAVQKSCELLGIPDDAASVDVLIMAYKVKNGRVKVTHRATCDYINSEVFVFVQDDALCLADCRRKYAIPMDSIVGARRISKRISAFSWNKKTPYNKGEYKPYKIRMKDGHLLIKPYYAVDIRYDGEDYELLFPCYEWEQIRRLTGLTAEEDQKQK